MAEALVAGNPGSVEEARRISRLLKPSRRWHPMQLTNERSADGAPLYANQVYCATLRRFESGWPLGGGPWAAIGIFCPDGMPRHDFRDFQRIKNDLVGAEWEAIELYPAESRLMDPSKYYMLWAAPKIPVGKYSGRVFANPKNCLVPQRGWAGDEPAEAAVGL